MKILAHGRLCCGLQVRLARTRLSRLTYPGRGSLRPPAASRCSARASLRAPSRGDPPLRGLGGSCLPPETTTTCTYEPRFPGDAVNFVPCDASRVAARGRRGRLGP